MDNAEISQTAPAPGPAQGGRGRHRLFIVLSMVAALAVVGSIVMMASEIRDMRAHISRLESNRIRDGSRTSVDIQILRNDLDALRKDLDAFPDSADVVTRSDLGQLSDCVDQLINEIVDSGNQRRGGSFTLCS